MAVVALAFVVTLGGGGYARSDSGPNAIQVENAKPGTPGWDDFFSIAQQDAISGFASKTSVNHGDSIDLYVTTTAPTFTIDVFRMGWYGGVGARRVASLGSFTGVHQAIPPPDPKTGMVSCDNWTKTTTLAVPSDWVTGVYLAKLSASNGNKSYIYFVVRDDGGHEPVLFQSSVSTYQAYNAWGGVSLYTNNTNKSVYPYAEATKVSYNRPFDPLDSNGAGQFGAYEYPFIRWAESKGYDVSYITDVDTATNVNPLTNHRVYLSVGHDEYWSKSMRDNVTNAIAHGMNAAFFSANTAYWQIRFEPDAAGNPNRVQVGYKVYATDNGLPGPDPQWHVNNAIVTTRFRDDPVNQPENGLLGVMYQDQVQRDYPYVVQNADNWIYAGTGFVNGQSIPGIVGYEYDKVWNNGASPPGETVLSNSPVVGCCEGSGNSFSNSTLYTAPSGAQVFAGGTIQWAWGLDNYSATYANAGIQKTTANILDRFSATPAPPNAATPMPLVSRGLPAYASSTLAPAGSANDSDYSTYWSGSIPGWIAYDVSGVPAAQRGKMVLAWYNDPQTSPYDHSFVGEPAYNSLRDYTIEANAAPGGGSAPTSGWVTLATVTGNHYHSRQHSITLTGYNWVRLNVTAGDGSSGNTNASFNLDLHDASAGLGDSWIFYGDSIAMDGLHHEPINGTGNFSQLVSTATGGKFYPAYEDGGTGGTGAADGASQISTWLSAFPGRYVALAFGTNDANGCGSTSAFYANYVTMVQAVIAAGKVPIVPTIPWARTANIQSCGPGFNAQIQSLYAAFPQIVKGPDLWAYFQSHQSLVSSDDLHPSAAGYVAYRQQWVDAMNTAVYAGTAAAPGVTLTPASLAFGSQAIGTPATKQTVLQNSGNAALTMSSISVTGANASDFTASSNCPTAPATLAAGASCTVSVTFTPQAAAPRTATISIADDAPGSPQTVSLTGTGTSTSPAVALSPASVTFASQVVGTPSSAQAVSVQNVGGGPLAISSIAVNGAASADYATTTNCPLSPATLAAGASCTVNVTFTPSVVGSRPASLNVVDNAAGSPHSAPLSGTGALPATAGLDKNLGTKTENVGGTTMTLTTAAAASTGTRVVAFLVWNGASATLSSVAGGGLAWTVDSQVKDTNNDHVAIASAAAPNGLASGTVLTGTFSASVTHGLIAGASFAGVATTSPVDAARTSTGSGAAAWSAAVPTSTATDVVVGFSVFDANATSTPTAPNTEIHDFGDSAYWGWATSVYQVTSSAGTATAAGKWSATTGATSNGTVVVAYKAAAAAAPAPAVTLAPASLQLGSQRLHTTGQPFTSTLTNSGSAPLTISSLAVAGTNAADFASTSNCPLSPSTLAANASCTVSVTFTPNATGARSASVQIADDAAGSPQALQLAGTGTAPAVTTTPAAGLDFGSQIVNTTSAPKTVTLTNTGTAPLAISGISTALEAQGDYTIASTDCPAAPATLAAGASCVVNVTFTPTTSGNRGAALRISDDAAGTPQSVPLTGVGTVPAPAVSLSPTGLTFAAQIVGTSSASQSVTLTNTGAAALTITSIGLSGSNPADFAQSSTCPVGPATVAPGGTCRIDVTFTPTATGSRGATLQVADDASGSPQSVSIAGTGSASSPTVTLSPPSASFGNQRVGTTGAATLVTLQNTGTAPLTISSIAVAGTNASDFATVDNCPDSPVQLSAGASCTISVTFSPSATGARSASVQVTDDAPGSPQAVALSGTGTAPAVTLSPATLGFGSQPLNTSSAAQSTTLTNSGTAPLAISGIALTGANTGDFSFTSTCPSSPATLAAGATCAVSVTFRPTAAGARSATLQVTDDAATSPQSVTLSGTGSTSSIGFDKSLGTLTQNVGGTTMKLTTSAAAVAHTRVFVFVQWANASRTLTGVAGGGLTWTVDYQAKSPNNEHLAIASADAPAGLASGTVVTATFSGSVTLGLMAGASFSGIASTTPVDASASATAAGVRAWTASVTRSNPTDLVLGFSTIDANTTSTATAPATEIHDFGTSAYYAWSTTAYAITSAAGSTTVAGTWAANTGATGNLTVAVAYKGA